MKGKKTVSFSSRKKRMAPAPLAAAAPLLSSPKGKGSPLHTGDKARKAGFRPSPYNRCSIRMAQGQIRLCSPFFWKLRIRSGWSLPPPCRQALPYSQTFSFEAPSGSSRAVICFTFSSLPERRLYPAKERTAAGRMIRMHFFIPISFTCRFYIPLCKNLIQPGRAKTHFREDALQKNQTGIP